MAQPHADPPSPAETAFVTAIAAYQARTQALRFQVEGYVRRLWASLGAYRNSDMASFLRQVVPVILGAQQTIATLTVANLAQQRQIALGGRFSPVPFDVRTVSGAGARNGVAPVDVYGRPFHLVWRQLDELPREPGSIEKAIAAGEQRAVDLASDDIQLTKQHTALEVLGHDNKVVGYRRVLEGAYSCGLCIVASTQRYHREELLPVHGGCDCSVAGIWGTTDPGRVIEAAARVDGQVVPVGELPDVHDRIAERFGADASTAGARPRAPDAPGRILHYRDALITHEHGELGPVLGVRGQPFTGPNDL